MSTFGSVLNLSSLNGTNGFQISGESKTDQSGNSVASAGDVNGDGFDDLIIGAWRADVTNPNGYSGNGAAYVVFGKASGFDADINLSSLNGTNGFQLSGETAINNDYAGVSVSSAGDINGDGFADLLIGAHRADPNNLNYSGATYVVFGKADGFSAELSLSAIGGSNGFKITGEASYDGSGMSVAAAGDVNNDGHGDLIIAAPVKDKGAAIDVGAVYVVFGGGTYTATLDLGSLDGSNGFQISGSETGGLLGKSVASAGDVNDDGIADIIVGAPNADVGGSTDNGAAYIVFGKTTAFSADLDVSSFDGTNGFRIIGEVNSGTAGRSVSLAGDINGDGIDDIIVGADRAFFKDGAAYVVFGTDAGFSGTVNVSSLNGKNGFQLTGAESESQTGRSVSAAGDINGEGFDDLLVSALYEGSGVSFRAGAVYVVYGNAGGFSANVNLADINGSNGFVIYGETAQDRLGGSVATAGDVNNDGLDDIIIGAAFANPNNLDEAGASYVIFGARAPSDTTAPTLAITLSDNALTTGETASVTFSFSEAVTGFAVDDITAPHGVITSLTSSNNIIWTATYTPASGVDDATNLISVNMAGVQDAAANAGTGIANSANFTILTNTGNDSITGGVDSDSLNGGAGNDTLYGGAANDTLEGGTGNDMLDGGTGNDLLYGGAGNDVFILDSVGDLVFDASGVDEVRAAFSLNLTNAAFSAMENASLLGSGHGNLTGDGEANVLTGNAGRNAIAGGLGADTLIGGAGNDTITGGAGRDIMSGGADRDVFKFVSMADMTTSVSTTDVITEFQRGSDKIDLSAIDANSIFSDGNSKFTFDDKTAYGTSKDGDIYYAHVGKVGSASAYTLVFIDTDADKFSEGVIKVMGLHNFTAGDFIL